MEDEKKFRNETPIKSKIGMGVSKMVSKEMMKEVGDLELNTDMESVNRDGHNDFPSDFYSSNRNSGRNSIHSIRTTTTNAEFGDTESMANFDPEAYKKKAIKKIPQLKNVGQTKG